MTEAAESLTPSLHRVTRDVREGMELNLQHMFGPSACLPASIAESEAGARAAFAAFLEERHKVELYAEALDVLQGMRLEHDDALEVWYLVCCAALQAGEAPLALAEAEAACEFAQSDACPPDEREWLAQLLEVCEEARAMAQDVMTQ